MTTTVSSFVPSRFQGLNPGKKEFSKRPDLNCSQDMATFGKAAPESVGLYFGKRPPVRRASWLPTAALGAAALSPFVMWGVGGDDATSSSLQSLPDSPGVVQFVEGPQDPLNAFLATPHGSELKQSDVEKATASVMHSLEKNKQPESKAVQTVIAGTEAGVDAYIATLSDDEQDKFYAAVNSNSRDEIKSYLNGLAKESHGKDAEQVKALGKAFLTLYDETGGDFSKATPKQSKTFTTELTKAIKSQLDKSQVVELNRIQSVSYDSEATKGFLWLVFIIGGTLALDWLSGHTLAQALAFILKGLIFGGNVALKPAAVYVDRRRQGEKARTKSSPAPIDFNRRITDRELDALIVEVVNIADAKLGQGTPNRLALRGIMIKLRNNDYGNSPDPMDAIRDDIIGFANNISRNDRSRRLNRNITIYISPQRTSSIRPPRGRVAFVLRPDLDRNNRYYAALCLLRWLLQKVDPVSR